MTSTSQHHILCCVLSGSIPFSLCRLFPLERFKLRSCKWDLVTATRTKFTLHIYTLSNLIIFICIILHPIPHRLPKSVPSICSNIADAKGGLAVLCNVWIRGRGKKLLWFEYKNSRSPLSLVEMVLTVYWGRERAVLSSFHEVCEANCIHSFYKSRHEQIPTNTHCTPLKLLTCKQIIDFLIKGLLLLSWDGSKEKNVVVQGGKGNKSRYESVPVFCLNTLMRCFYDGKQIKCVCVCVRPRMSNITPIIYSVCGTVCTYFVDIWIFRCPDYI